MSTFASITTRANAQTIDQTWFNTLQAAGSTLETRYNNLTSNAMIPLGCMGQYDQFFGVAVGLQYFVVPTATTIGGCNVIHFKDSGGSGYLEIDLQRKTGSSSFVSVFTQRPRVGMTGTDFTNSNAGGSSRQPFLDSTQTALLNGDILRLDITAIPSVASGVILTGFMCQLFANPTGA